MIDCIFCQIVKGKIPCYKIYEDKDFLAFLDINPLNPGHTLVITKKHYKWVIDVPKFGTYWERVGKIAKAVQKALKADSLNFVVLGYEIFHAHIHIVPRFSNDDLGGTINWANQKKFTKERMEQIAQSIKKEIKEGGRRLRQLADMANQRREVWLVDANSGPS
jgi:histidine triad (HIT) family protein